MKKFTKRLLTAVLTGAMIFSLGAIPTFAAQGNDGQIIITNPSTDVTYNAYKIFDLDYSGDNYAYTIDNSSPFFNVVQTYATDTNGLTLTQVGETTTYNVTIDMTKFSAANFGVALKAAVTSTVPVDATETDNTTTKDLSLGTGLPYGYYLVVGNNKDGMESLVSLDTTNKEAHIIEKNSTPGWHSEDPENPDDAKGKTIKITEDGQEKYVETTDISIGQTVTFAIRIDAKNYIEDNLINSYVIKDSLPNGFTFGSITSVKVDDTSLGNTEYTNNGFPTDSIEIPWATEDTDGYWTSKYAPSTVITIEYTATLNSNAVIDGPGNENKAVFTYTYGKTPDNPNPDTPPTIPDNPSEWTHSDSATVYTYAIALKKINKSGEALAGATFSLPDGMIVSAVSGKTNTYVVDPTATGDNAITSITTSGTDASFTIIGVAAGDYEFTETEAPSGYNKLTSPVSVTAKQVSETTTTTNTIFYLDKNGDIVDTETDKTVTVTYTNNDYAVTPVAVVNLTGTELPSTGGMGTTIFYVVGAILVIGAGVILIARRRMSAR